MKGYPGEVRWSSQHYKVAKASSQGKSNRTAQPQPYKIVFVQKLPYQAGWTQGLNP